MIRTIALSFAILVAFMALLVYKDTKSRSFDPPKEDLSSFASWHLYTSPTNSFQVFFPNLPQNASTTVRDHKTGQLKHYNTSISEKDNLTTYMVNVITLHDEEAKGNEYDLLKKLVQEMVLDEGHTQVKSLKNIELKSGKAVEFFMTHDDVDVRGQAIKRGNKIYVITAMTKDPNYDNKEANFFFNSFEITGR